MAVIVKGDNGTVSDTYLEMIGETLSGLGEKVCYVDSYRKVFDFPKDELVVNAISLETFHLILRGYRHIILWFQGVAPEENYLVHHNLLKLAVFNMIEWVVVRSIDFSLYVSETMKRYMAKKYRLPANEDRCYCMPCMNTELHPEAFFGENKYGEMRFAYVGSLTVWQSFEDTADLYAEIEKAFGGRTRFLVFTGEKEKAEQILKSRGIRNYTIDFVPNEQLPAALSGVKYGFIVRKDNTVNRVATPTKISTYLSCGVIPIYSTCLEDFDRAAKNMRYVVPAGADLISRLQAMESAPIDPEEVLREYQGIFGSYYARDRHMRNLKAKLAPVYEALWKKGKEQP